MSEHGSQNARVAAICLHQPNGTGLVVWRRRGQPHNRPRRLCPRSGGAHHEALMNATALISETSPQKPAKPWIMPTRRGLSL